MVGTPLPHIVQGGGGVSNIFVRQGMCGIHVLRREKKGSNFNRQKQVCMPTLRIRLFHVITRYKIITFCRARIQNQLRKVSRDNTTETFSQKYSEKLRGLYTLHVIAFHV